MVFKTHKHKNKDIIIITSINNNTGQIKYQLKLYLHQDNITDDILKAIEKLDKALDKAM